MITIIAALGKNRVLGKDNKLLWHLPEDLRRFKEITTGHPVIMGQKTYESIGRPLPNRTNIVLSTNPAFKAEGCLIAHSLPEALEKARRANDEIFIIGGGMVYREALPIADRLYLTLIDNEKEGDTFFPEYEHQFRKTRKYNPREWDGINYQWIDFERIANL